MPPNEPSVMGSEALGAWFEGFFGGADIVEASLTDDDIGVVGEAAYRCGTYEMTFKMGDGDPVSDSGKFVEIWKKQADGSWKIARDIWNSNAPAPSE